MSMFDAVERKGLADTFGIGNRFALLGARYDGLKSTEYGPSPTATVVAAPLTPDGAQEARGYKVFGNLAEQIENMGEDDLPAVVSIEKHGRANVWFPHERLPKDQAIDVEAANESDEPI